MKLASYNVENMFLRPKALYDPKTKRADRKVLEAYSRLTDLLEQDSYASDREEILKLLAILGLEKDDESKLAVLRKIRGRLLMRPKKRKPVELVAKGRGDWVGWVELTKGEVNSAATHNTAAVITDLDPDVLAVVEAENRLALERFNEYVLKEVAKKEGQAWQFEHVMLVDGNDERGIDVGLLAKAEFLLKRMRSHIDDEKDGRRVFSRDCIEHEITTPGGGLLLLMINHFKSKGYRGEEPPDVTRRRQAAQVAKIYKERRKEGWKWIAIAGDLNDTPDSEPLEPLIAKTDLKDAGTHKSFDWGPRTGTYESGKDQIDYLLLSPALYKLIKAGGVNRKGVWHGPRTKNPWAMLPTLTSEAEAASDHAAIWVDLDC